MLLDEDLLSGPVINSVVAVPKQVPTAAPTIAPKQDMEDNGYEETAMNPNGFFEEINGDVCVTNSIVINTSQRHLILRGCFIYKLINIHYYLFRRQRSR